MRSSDSITSRCRAHRFFTPSPRRATVDKQREAGPCMETGEEQPLRIGRLAVAVLLRTWDTQASTSITFSTPAPNTPLTQATHNFSTHSLSPTYIHQQPLKYTQNGRHQAGQPPSPHRLPTPQFCFSTGLLIACHMSHLCSHH